MVGDHLGRILDRIACLLVGAGLFQNMGGKHIPDIVRSVGKQPLDGSAAGIGIVDAIALDDEPPGFVKGRLIISRVLADHFDRLDEKRARMG